MWSGAGRLRSGKIRSGKHAKIVLVIMLHTCASVWDALEPNKLVMDSWVSQKCAIADLELDIRNEVVAHWKKAAQEEHASIASFSRLTMQLMALGAPPELLHASIQAQADELSHAKACLHVVSLLR